MNDLQIINISGVDCYEQDGTAYLNLEAVARGLGFITTQNINGIEYENVRWNRVDGYLNEIGFATSGKRPEFVPENIFYRLAMKAKNAAAEAFQAKIADEVIPSIRKHGAYMTTSTIERVMKDPDSWIALLTALKAEREQRQTLESKIEADKPKVIFSDAVAASKTSILIGELAKIIKQNGVDIGQNRLFEWMRNNGYLIKRKGTDYNMPTQEAMERGLFEIKETAVTHSDGHISVNKTPKVTGKGQNYFVNLFLAERSKLKGGAEMMEKKTAGTELTIPYLLEREYAESTTSGGRVQIKISLEGTDMHRGDTEEILAFIGVCARKFYLYAGDKIKNRP